MRDELGVSKLAEEEGQKEEGQKKETEKTPEKKGNKGLVVLVVVAVVLVGLFFAGRLLARKLGETVLSGVFSRFAGENIKVEGDGDSVTLRGEEGEVSLSTEGSLPEDFPKDFPVYSGAKVVSSFKASGGETNGVSVVWETKSSTSQVADFYKQELTKGGWKTLSTFEGEGSVTLTFEKGEVSGFLGITQGEGGATTISVTLGVKE